MTKIFIATPAFQGNVNVQYAISLAETYCDLARNGIECDIRMHCSGSLLVAERNRLVKAFLETDSTHMLCIDSDLGWPFQYVKHLINHDLDFVGGIYPTRRENAFLFRPKLNPDQSIVMHEKKLLGMEYIPAGFMLIKRCVFEKIIQDTPELHFQPKDPKLPNGHCIFNTEVREGEFWGEDYVFCRLARESGFEIWVDPTIEFDHSGVRGSLMNVLTEDKNKAQVSCEKEV